MSGGSVRGAALYALAQRYFAFSLQLGVSVIVARLLTPEETGIFALAVGVSVIAQMLREFGVSDYLIAQKETDNQKLRAAFTVMTAVSATVGLLLLAIAWPLSRLYGEPGVARVLSVLSVTYFLLPLGIVPMAQLSKALRYRELFWVQNASALASASTTLLCAYAGLSYMSLAYGMVAGSVATILTLMIWSPQHMWMRPTRHGFREVFRFSGGLTIGRIADQLANRSYELIIGALLGFHGVGLVSKSQGLVNSFHDMFASALTGVAKPALARARHEGRDVRQAYFRATHLLAPVMWMFLCLLAVFAEEVILLLFGGNWLECVSLLRIMCITSLAWGPFMLAYPLFASAGLVKGLVRIQLVCAPVLALCVYTGALFSLFWAVLLPSFVSVLRLWMTQQILQEEFGISLGNLLSSLKVSIFLCAAVAAVAIGLREFLHSMHWPSYLVLFCGGGASVLLGIVLAKKCQLVVWLEVGEMIKSRRSGR